MTAADGRRGTGETPSSEDVRVQLQRILDSQIFQKNKRRSVFLAYVIEEALAGRGHLLKGVGIAMSVFNRDETFDQRVDPIVRLEARRLRSELDSYYATDGRWDSIRITLPKGGYVPQFDWQETESAQGVSSGVSSEVSEGDPTLDQSDSGHLAATSAKRLSLRSWSLGLGGGLLVLLVAVFALWRYDVFAIGDLVSSAADSDPALALPKGPSIAVLPFFNLSGDDDKQYITDGFTEQLTTELIRFDGLWVLPFGAAQLYKDGLVDPRALHREFGVDYVLEGSVRTTGDSLRVTSRLIEAETGSYVWVRRFDTDFTPVRFYDVQDSIAVEVAGNLAGEYGVLAQGDWALSKRKAPDSLDAYDCVLRYYDYQRALSKERHGDVKACLERAVELEPDYAEAWAVLSNVYMQEKRFWRDEETLDEDLVATKAKAAAKSAIAIEPDNATAWMMLSNLLFTEGDLEGFRQAGEAALRLNPNSSDVLAHFGLRLGALGDWERGFPLASKAITLNPFHPDWYRFVFVFHSLELGDYDEALARLDLIDMPGFFWTPLLRAATLGQMGQLEEAGEAVQILLALKPKIQQQGADFLKLWQLSPALYAHIVEGLARAGLTIDTKSNS